MAASQNEAEYKQTVNVSECFEAACEVATQAGKVKTISMFFRIC